jgi:tetrahydromethanopterin S-methyltransferase subunit C
LVLSNASVCVASQMGISVACALWKVAGALHRPNEHEQQHLTNMLNAGVIQPSTSAWASAPVLVRKKDGTVMWCVDYRAVNDRTTKDTLQCVWPPKWAYLWRAPFGK